MEVVGRLETLHMPSASRLAPLGLPNRLPSLERLAGQTAICLTEWRPHRPASALLSDSCGRQTLRNHTETVGRREHNTDFHLVVTIFKLSSSHTHPLQTFFVSSTPAARRHFYRVHFGDKLTKEVRISKSNFRNFTVFVISF